MRLMYLGVFSWSMLLFSCGDQQNQGNDEADIVDTKGLPEVYIEMQDTIIINAADGLEIEGYLYQVGASAPCILLCHQAMYNKHEYDEIAIRLNDMGYNCLAIDQRSGGPLNGFDNHTTLKAEEKGLKTAYTDAEQDILAGINYMSLKYGKPIILWGSSYSSALALHMGKGNPNVSAVISFSPGDYFEDAKQPLTETMKDFEKPFFITSSKAEQEGIKAFMPADAVYDDIHIQFIPENEGKHGSKALWSAHENNAEYWTAISSFLDALIKKEIN